jgi:TonB family protein
MPPPVEPRPTEASPPPTMAVSPMSQARPTVAEESSRSLARPMVLALVGLVAIGLAIVAGYFLLTAVSKTNSDDLATATPSPLATPTVSTTPFDSPQATPGSSTKPTPTPLNKSEATPTPYAASLATPPPPAATAYPTSPPPKEQVDYSKPFTRGEVDQPAQILSRPKPSYTEAARQNQVQGVVSLRIVLGASGTVTNVSVIKGLSYGLTENAIQAARQIKFTPAQKDGRAVSQYATVEMNFSLY